MWPLLRRSQTRRYLPTRSLVRIQSPKVAYLEQEPPGGRLLLDVDGRGEPSRYIPATVALACRPPIAPKAWARSGTPSGGLGHAVATPSHGGGCGAVGWGPADPRASGSETAARD